MSCRIRVAVRIKPSASSNGIWTADGATKSICEKGDENVFTFDDVYSGSSKTSTIYDDVAKDIVNDALNGTNGTIFAYGQTGSGKTFTMTGDSNSPGIIPLSIKDIFSFIQTHTTREFVVGLSCFEVYNENIFDLINPGDQIRQLSRITRQLTSSTEEMMGYIDAASDKRRVGSTMMNERSSRSHAVVRITIESREKEGDQAVLKSQLDLVDLAGSECAKQTEAKRERQVEASKINQSLLALSNVIRALSKNQQHPPFADSKLTQILRDSLGGNAKTAIISTISNEIDQKAVSKNTLRFASSARMIKNKPVVNKVENEKAMIARLMQEIDYLKGQLTQLKSGKNEMEEVEREKYEENKTRLLALRASIMNSAHKTSKKRKRSNSFPGKGESFDENSPDNFLTDDKKVMRKDTPGKDVEMLNFPDEEIIILPARKVAKKEVRTPIVKDAKLLSTPRSPLNKSEIVQSPRPKDVDAFLLQNENERLKAMVTEYEQENKELTARLGIEKSPDSAIELATTQDQLKYCEDEKQKLQEICANQTQQIDDMTERINKLEETKERKSEEVQVEDYGMKAKETEFVQMNSRLEEKVQRITGENEKLKTEIEEVRNKNQMNECVISKMECEIKAKKEDLSREDEELKALREKHSQLLSNPLISGASKVITEERISSGIVPLRQKLEMLRKRNDDVTHKPQRPKLDFVSLGSIELPLEEIEQKEEEEDVPEALVNVPPIGGVWRESRVDCFVKNGGNIIQILAIIFEIAFVLIRL